MKRKKKGRKLMHEQKVIKTNLILGDKRKKEKLLQKQKKERIKRMHRKKRNKCRIETNTSHF